MKILHITPHLGGGCGSVILGWINKNSINEHNIVSLGYVTDNIIKICYENKIQLYSDFKNKNYDLILDEIKYNDIVIIHYWNFPLLIDFLINNILPECRLITWFHNSGFHDPSGLSEQIINISDKFVFTSPISYQLPVVKRFSFFDTIFDENKFDCIWATGGVDKFLNIEKKKHEGFNILYVGTLDYAKLHIDFIPICEQIIHEIPEATITVCGTGCNIFEIAKEIAEKQLEDKIKLQGLVSNLIPYFEEADLFLYPLQENHFGTCEQVLGEAMASGTVSLVFYNEAEKQIIKHFKNGIIASDIDAFVKYIKLLKDDVDLRGILSENAKQDAKELYNIDKMINNWNSLFNDIIKLDKKERVWKNFFENIYGRGTISFLESLNIENRILFDKYIAYERQIINLFKSNYQWQSESKGSIKQYLQYFPDDYYLKKLQKLMDEEI